MARFVMLVSCALAVTACEQSAVGIGPRGGEVISGDGRLSVVVPAGALSETVDIEIAEVTDRPEGAVGPAYELLPVGTAFARPATVTFELEDDDLQYFRDLALVSRKGEHWYFMADRKLDTSEMTLCASAGYLSTFAVVGHTVE